MTRRDWWGVGLMLVIALLVWMAVPRYQWQHSVGMYWLRVDRWTGHAEMHVPPRVVNGVAQ